MPPQTRSQRRRQAARQQRPQPRRDAASQLQDTPLVEAEASELPEAAASRAPQATRATRARRSRSAPEPVDYTREYRAVARDLRWILLWSALLFGTMLVLAFSGLV